MSTFVGRFGSLPSGEDLSLLDLSSGALFLGTTLLHKQLHTRYCNLVLECEGLAVRLSGCRFDLGLLVTLLDSHPLTTTHSGSALPLRQLSKTRAGLFSCL